MAKITPILLKKLSFSLNTTTPTIAPIAITPKFIAVNTNDGRALEAHDVLPYRKQCFRN